MSAPLPPKTDPELELLVPANDCADPELSIVIPALNEEITIGEFVAWCHEGLAKAGVKGEILIVDSSTDRTAEIALAAGARVLKAPKRGLGRAYIDSLPFIRGKWVLMGDCDCTYDFRELAPFVEAMRGGAEYVMGSRFRGYIEPGAMPPTHRYFGTPGTTWVLNRLFASKFTDIHCGMRGMTKDALVRMDLQSQSWEYASELVLKSVHLKLRTTEVPIRFLKDKEGRLSHHRRMGWFSPWQAGWINLKAMFVNGPDFFLYRPGQVLFLLGALLVLGLSLGPVTAGPVTLSLYSQLLGLFLSSVGLPAMYLGILATVFFDYTSTRTQGWVKRFPYTATTWLCVGLFLGGAGLASMLGKTYLDNDLRLPATLSSVNSLAVTGLWLMATAFQTFTFMLLLHAATVVMPQRLRAPR